MTKIIAGHRPVHRCVRRFLACVVVATCALVASSAGAASATWSIVAADPETGRVGAAIASCVPASILGDLDKPLVPLVIIPGSTAAVSQAQLNVEAPARIEELVDAGEVPADIMVDLSSPEFDELSSLRQHAIADLEGRAAAFTGADNSPAALDRQGPAVSVQGNILVSPAVVDDALASFVDSMSTDADLAGALVAGLVAGSEAGGDSRCPASTALFAQIVVAEPGDDPQAPTVLLTVVIDEGSEENPVLALQEQFSAGERGVVELGGGAEGSAGLARTILLVAAVIALGIAALVFKRGLGSTKARR